MRARAVAVVVAGAVLLAGCGSSAKSGPGKYTQTWGVSYDATSCAQWANRMSDHQRWVAAADMLVGGRKTWGVTDMPTDSLVDKFEASVTTGCQPDAALMISDIATTLLLTGGKTAYGS